MKTAAREFKVTPPDMRFPAILLGLSTAVCLGLIAYAWRDLHAASLQWVIVIGLLVPVVLLVSILRRKVIFDGETLDIRAGLNRARVVKLALNIAAARIVDLDTHPDLRIGIKVIGTHMPGYHAGHFRQIGGSKVFALVTDKRRVLVIPEHTGRLLMLSLENPQALLDALRA